MSRIVLVVGKATGGIGIHVRDLAAGLAGLGHDVEVVTDPLTARTFGLDHARLLWPDPTRPDPRRLAQLRRLLRGADLVHAHGHQAGIVAGAALGRRRRGGVPLVISLHNELPAVPGPARAAVERAERVALGRAELVTGASDDLVAAARSLGAGHTQLAPVPSPRVPALAGAGPEQRAGARERVRTAYGLPGDLPWIVTISRIAPQKDLPTLVAAAAQLRTRVRWLVAGSGVADLLADLREQATTLGSPVDFLGPVSAPEDLLLAADLFVLTSTWEARALVVQEAMAAGLPVIAPAVGGLPGLLADGGGVLVPPGDPAATAQAVEELLADPARRAALGARGREVARGWDDLDAATRAWSTAYDRLIVG